MADREAVLTSNPMAGNEFSLSLIESAEQSHARQLVALEKARAAYEREPTHVNRNAVRWWEGEIRKGVRIINGMRERNGLRPMGEWEAPDAPASGPSP